MAVSVVTMAWYTTFDCRHFPSRGHSDFFQRLQSFFCSAGTIVAWDNVLFYCDEMIDFMLGMHEQLSLSIFLLKILCKRCFLLKHLSTKFKNFLPRLVLTLEFHGGLYHTMLLFLLRVARSQTLIIRFHNYHLATTRIVYIANIWILPVILPYFLISVITLGHT